MMNPLEKCAIGYLTFKKTKTEISEDADVFI